MPADEDKNVSYLSTDMSFSAYTKAIRMAKHLHFCAFIVSIVCIPAILFEVGTNEQKKLLSGHSDLLAQHLADEVTAEGSRDNKQKEYIKVMVS